MTKVIAVVNQKGGVGKTTTTANLGIGLANAGKRVLLIDYDAQGNLTESLGYANPDSMNTTISTMMQKVMEEKDFPADEGILHHKEGVDLMPANIELSGMETALVNVMSRESVLKGYIDAVKDNYDYILIDCTPSLGMLTINALNAANETIIPVQAHYLPAKGLEQLVKSVGKVKRALNPNLKIGGILLTMVDSRVNLSKEVANAIKEAYGKHIKIFDTKIPYSIKAAETAATGKSIFAYNKNGKVAEAYRNLAKEVVENGKDRTKHRSELIR